VRLSRFAAVASAAVLTAALAACGSSEKTVDQQAGSAGNAGALVGVTMPIRLLGALDRRR
jgi:putative multiple sugar transport system substrate-binding protein